MPRAHTFKIEGLGPILRKLEAFPEKVQRNVLRTAMRKGMKIVHAEVRRQVPVDTGKLRKSIKVRMGKRSRKGFSVNVQIGEGDFKGDTFYGAFQEYGWSGHSGRHYMRKSFDAAGPTARKSTEIDIRNGILEEARKHA